MKELFSDYAGLIPFIILLIATGLIMAIAMGGHLLPINIILGIVALWLGIRLRGL